MVPSCAHKFLLVVEDEADIRDTLKDVLEIEGYRVQAAEDGAQALRLLKKGEHPCLILLDLMMPVMNGWEFLDAVCRDEKLAAIPIIVITAATHRSPARACGLIKKPVAFEVLLAAVRQYCGLPGPPRDTNT